MAFRRSHNFCRLGLDYHGTEDKRLLDNILQLPDVAREIVVHKPCHGWSAQVIPVLVTSTAKTRFELRRWSKSLAWRRLCIDVCPVDAIFFSSEWA
jgi:hypothetical protein